MAEFTRSDSAAVVKICGITNPADAVAAVECGANALGFNLFPDSRRFVQIDALKPWIQQLPPTIRRVAVVVNPTLEDAMKIVDSGLFHGLQLHGDESPEFCRTLAARGVRFTKAMPVIDELSVKEPTDFFTSSVLLDSRTPQQFGGSGKAFPWTLARQFIELHPELRVTLAGGLTPENVAEAIRIARPAEVDVTSGVEAAFGRKDRARLQAFISAVGGA